MKTHAVTNTVASIVNATPQALIGTESIIYLMGFSFMIGGLFTILVLVLLDFMKRDRVAREPD